MPILGIMASQISGHLWAPAGAYDALASVTVPSGGVTSLTFSGIPTGYKHLQIRAISKAPQYTSIICRFNSDSTSSYSRHYLQGSGSGASASGSSSQTSIINLLYSSDSASNNYGTFITDILDYSSSTKNKTTRTLWGQDFNGSGYIGLDSGAWYNTSAITTITLSTSAGQTISEFSQFALYGVR
jgi:hypothetical protein